MTVPKVRTETKNGARWYVIGGDDPVRLPGVSSIVGMMPKPALVPAAVKATAAYAVRNRVKLLDMPKTAAFDALKAAYRNEWNLKADKGTEVHAAAEAVMRAIAVGEKPTGVIATDVLAYIKNLIRWVREFDVTPVFLERTVVNLSVGYAGTLDGLYWVTLPDGRRVLLIVDTKSGGSGIYGEAALQQTAYVHAEYYVDPDTNDLVPMPDNIAGAYALWLRPNGFSMIPLDTGAATFEQFKRLHASYEWQREHEKTLVLPPINAEPLRKSWTPPDLG